MRELAILLTIFLLVSCKEAKPQEAIMPVPRPEIAAPSVGSGLSHPDYERYKTLLEVLRVLPDASMASWEWPAHDRRNWVDDVKRKGLTLDSTGTYRVRSIHPHYLKYQVVDGYWTMAIYPQAKGWLVITDDVVGDGHSINVYHYDGKAIAASHDFIDDLLTGFMRDPKRGDCTSYFDDSAGFHFDFSVPDRIEVGMPGIDKVSQGECFKGNRAIFDWKDGKFVLRSIIWEDFPTEE